MDAALPPCIGKNETVENIGKRGIACVDYCAGARETGNGLAEPEGAGGQRPSGAAQIALRRVCREKIHGCRISLRRRRIIPQHSGSAALQSPQAGRSGGAAGKAGSPAIPRCRQLADKRRDRQDIGCALAYSPCCTPGSHHTQHLNFFKKIL